MPIRPPSLDDRSYDDLVEELLARIPAHTPEWTNPRPGDPGRTLIELFAWLADTILYRANLIPERQRLAFLRLLGLPLRPAQAARGVVSVRFQDDALLAASKIRALAEVKGSVPFETRDELTVLPVGMEAYYKRRPGDADRIESGLEHELATLHGLNGGAQLYVTTAAFPGGAAEPAGLGIAEQSVDRSLWLALLAPKPEHTFEARQALGGQLLNIGFIPAIEAADPLNPLRVRSRVPHSWEITTGDPPAPPAPPAPGAVEPRRQLQYTPLDEVRDTTDGLTRQGVVRVSLPDAGRLYAPPNDVRSDPDAGVGDRPPRLDDPAKASRLIAWVRLRASTPAPPPSSADVRFRGGESGSGPPPGAAAGEEGHTLRITWIGINAVEIDQRRTVQGRVIGQSAGLADQSYPLPAASVEPETFQLQVEEPGRGFVTWERVDDLAALDRDPALARDARVYVLDSEAGTVRFGDGVRGRVPEAAMRIRVGQMRAGGGAAGNLPPGSLKELGASTQEGKPAPALQLRQPVALAGGADPEKLEQAEKRIPAVLRHRDRAVTESDYRALALETPGVSVGRVALLPGFKPQQRFTRVPGVVSVMVLPAKPLGGPPNPRVDRPFIEAVHAWLDGRRPLGTELYVIGCEYVPLGVSVAIQVRDGAGIDTTTQAVRDALRKYLWPLKPGGIDGEGWPLGRAISNRELTVEVARVPGVAEVTPVNLFERRGSEWQIVGDPLDEHEKHLRLREWQLPELQSVLVVVDDNAVTAPADLRILPNPFAAPNLTPVPVVPEIC